MMRHGRNRRRRTESGAAAVEFALVLPLLMLLLFGIISYGVMLSFRQSLSQAAAEGARAAAVTFVEGQKQDEAYSSVNQALDSFGVTCTAGTLKKGSSTVGTCAVTTPGACTPAATGVKCVKVTLTYNYRDNPIVPSFLGIDIAIPKKLTYSAQARVS